jgi:hypothetical protein
MMRAVLAAAFLLAACSPAAKAPEAPAVSPFRPHTATVFPEDRGLELLNQCSRGVPDPIERTWTPAEGDILQLESRLVGYLRAQRPQTHPAGGPTPDLVRNYAGYVLKGGRRIIYLDAAIVEPGLFGIAPSDALPDRPFNGVCDGGPRFSGVEYDVQAKTFSNLLENGPY